MNNVEKALTFDNEQKGEVLDSEGTTWKNPGAFPEFAGDKVTPTNEEKDKGDSRAEELLAKITELESKEVPDGKFKLPSKCYGEAIEMVVSAGETEFTAIMDDRLNKAVLMIQKLEKMDGTVEKAVGEKLWSLYSDPEISVGIHGTVAEADSNLGSEDSSFFTDGIGCRYKDLKRTIAFQDRGKIHAHGDISFSELLDYDYPAWSMRSPLTIRKNISYKKDIGDGRYVESSKEVEVPARQFSAIVAIPMNYDTMDPALRGNKMKVAINNPFNRGKLEAGEVLKSDFVVGVVSDSDPNTIVWNPNFDAEKIRELSRQRKEEMEEEKERRANEAQQEQIPQPVPEKSRPATLRSKVFGFWKRNKTN